MLRPECSTASKPKPTTGYDTLPVHKIASYFP